MTLQLERDGGVASVTIDRPEAKNALDLATITELTRLVRETDARAMVLTGAGNTFVSGGDLRELRGRDSREDAAYLSDLGHALTSAIAEAPFPVIAALNGPAIGGGAELAIACDLRVAKPNANLIFKQVQMGVVTSWGSAARLIELVGHGTAARLLFGLALSCNDLLRIGLFDAVSDTPKTTSVEWGLEIARAPASAIAAMKRVLRSATTDRRALERAVFIDTWSSKEHAAAVEAWFAKRG
jgi:enoyl-CoA hydratase/carnithine racemase